MMHSQTKTRQASPCAASLTNAPIHNVFIAVCLKETTMTTAWHGHERGYGEGCKIQNLNDYDNREQSRCHQRLSHPHNNICRFHIITKNTEKHLKWVSQQSTITVSGGSHIQVHYHSEPGFVGCCQGSPIMCM